MFRLGLIWVCGFWLAFGVCWFLRFDWLELIVVGCAGVIVWVGFILCFGVAALWLWGAFGLRFGVLVYAFGVLFGGCYLVIVCGMLFVGLYLRCGV